MATKSSGKWIQKATAKMEKKGTVGAFGKATSSKIAAAKKKLAELTRKIHQGENFAATVA